MIWCKTEDSARLSAIDCLVENDIKSVTIGYDKTRKMWYVDRELFTEEEYKILCKERR